MSAAPDDVLEQLARDLGADAVVTDPDVAGGYATDWTGRFVGSTPGVVRPADAAEVVAVVRRCTEAGVALVPQGGNTGLVGGATPLAGELVLSTERLRGIDDVDLDAGQLTAGAGETIGAVQRAATKAGWRYAVDLASRDTATVGGTIATNAGGLRVLRFGATRQQVLGVEAVTGRGEVVRRLGGLRKDNTGYDLAGLLCGSEGTLAVVCRARLALVPAAGETVTALLGFDDVTTAIRAVGTIRRAVPTLEAAELVLAPGAALVHAHTGTEPVLSSAPAVQLVVEAVGPPDPTEGLAAAIEGTGATEVAVATDPARSAGLWHVREAHTESIASLGVPRKFDVTLPGGALAAFVEAVPDAVAEAVAGTRTWLFGHVADGNIHVNVTGVADGEDDRLEDVVLGAVVAHGGSISAEHGIGLAKRRWLRRDRGDGDVATMRALKQALDPAGVLNPGALLP